MNDHDVKSPAAEQAAPQLGSLRLPRAVLAMRHLCDARPQRYVSSGGVKFARVKGRYCTATATDGCLLLRLKWHDPLLATAEPEAQAWSVIVPASVLAWLEKCLPPRQAYLHLAQTIDGGSFWLGSGQGELRCDGLRGPFPDVQDVIDDLVAMHGTRAAPELILDPRRLARLLRVFAALESPDYPGVRVLLPKSRRAGVRIVSRDGALEAVLMPLLLDEESA